MGLQKLRCVPALLTVMTKRLNCTQRNDPRACLHQENVTCRPYFLQGALSIFPHASMVDVSCF